MALVYVYNLEKEEIFTNVNNIVILSPALYWFKVCEIPTKSITKAKKIASHMMSDKPTTFSDIVLFSKDNGYHAYAYNKKSITDLLKNLGLKNPKVYFANQLQLTEIMSVDATTNLYKFNHTVIETPATTSTPSKSLEYDYEQFLQAQKPMLSLESADKSVKMILSLSAGFFLLYILLFTFDKISILNTIEEETTNLGNKNRSFYEIKSLIKRYTKLDTKSNKLKEKFTQILKDDNLKSLSYKNGSFEVEK